MIYGYVVTETITVGHGQIWWDEYYETTEHNLIDVKLFNSEEERDKAMEEERNKAMEEANKAHYYGDGVHIIPIKHKGNLIEE